MEKHFKVVAVIILAVVYSSTLIAAPAAKDVKCNGCVDAKDIKKNAVTSSKIKNGAVSIKDLNSKLRDSVNSIATLSAAISSLQERLDAMEALNAGFNDGDFTGRVYCFFNLGRELVGGSPNEGIYISHSNVKLTFTSPTQVSILDLGDVDAMLYTDTGDLGTGDTRPGGGMSTESYSLTGNVLSIPGAELSLFVSPDGNLLVGNQAEIEGSDPDSVHNSNFRIAVRGDSC